MTRAVLLVWVHGFKGSETTFSAFPEHVTDQLRRNHPTVTIYHGVYPRFRTVGELRMCTTAFIRWVDRRVDAIQEHLIRGQYTAGSTPANGSSARSVVRPQTPVSNDVAVFLVGHSMGGLLVADAAAIINGLEQPYEEEEKSTCWPRSKSDAGQVEQADSTSSVSVPPARVRGGKLVRGVIAIDTPFIGIHPSLVTYGLDQLDAVVQKALLTSDDYMSAKPAYISNTWKMVKADKWLQQPTSLFKKDGRVRHAVEWGLGIPAQHSTPDAKNVMSCPITGYGKKAEVVATTSVSEKGQGSVTLLELPMQKEGRKRRGSNASDTSAKSDISKRSNGGPAVPRIGTESGRDIEQRLMPPPLPPLIGNDTPRLEADTDSKLPYEKELPPLVLEALMIDDRAPPVTRQTHSGVASLPSYRQAIGSTPYTRTYPMDQAPPLPPRPRSPILQLSAALPSSPPPPIPPRPILSTADSVGSQISLLNAPAISVADTEASANDGTSIESGSVTSTDNKDKHKKKKGFKWLMEHLTFVSALWALDDIKRRMNNLTALHAQGMIFVNIYAVIPPIANKPNHQSHLHGHKRTFISLPTKHHPTRECWKGLELDVQEQVEAHLSLFTPEKNDGYERLLEMVLEAVGQGLGKA